MFITKKRLARIIDAAVDEEIERREHARYINGRFEEVYERISKLERYIVRHIPETDVKE